VLVVAGDPPAPVEERYAAAVDVLAELHREERPAELPIEPELYFRIPRYDMDALMIEVELLADWYLPRFDVNLPDANRMAFYSLWREALKPATEAPSTWVLRDYHSPNLLWLPDREGVARIGLLDFQDAQIGSPAYDLASLLQDAWTCPSYWKSRSCRATRMPGGRPIPNSTRRTSRSFTRRWAPNALPRFWESSPASTAVTASRNICVTCRGYGAICNAR
jgi:aminoglycoside/choline kinase family phosphotransferase